MNQPEHDYDYPEDCQHPECKNRRIRRWNREITEWNRTHPDLLPKPTFDKYVEEAGGIEQNPQPK